MLRCSVLVALTGGDNILVIYGLVLERLGSVVPGEGVAGSRPLPCGAVTGLF